MGYEGFNGGYLEGLKDISGLNSSNPSFLAVILDYKTVANPFLH